MKSNNRPPTAAQEQISAHVANAVNAAERQAKIAGRIATLRERVAALGDETALDKAAAELAEAEKLVASSVASGDTQAEHNALAKLTAARKAVDTQNAALSGQAGLIAALEAEAAALDNEAERAGRESLEHRKLAFHEIGAILLEEWKASAAALLAAGSKLLVARAEAGEWSAGFADFKVPLFDSYDRTGDLGTMQDMMRNFSNEDLLREFAADRKQANDTAGQPQSAALVG